MGHNQNLKSWGFICRPPITMTWTVTSFAGDGVAQFVFASPCAPPKLLHKHTDLKGEAVIQEVS